MNPAPPIWPADLLDGRVALVTGASGDLGEAIARRLAAAGARVAVHFRSSRERAERLVAAIGEAGGEADALRADLAEPGQADALVNAAFERWGRLDVLVNNAGGSDDGFLMMQSAATVDDTLAVNLSSALHCCRCALPKMLRGRRGSIINIGSLSGTTGVKGQVAYSAAKAGVAGLTRALAQEMGAKGIRVNAVTPGLIESDVVRAMPAALADTRAVALRRLGRPDEVADTVLYLASDLSSYITGSVLSVDGGLHTGPC